MSDQTKILTEKLAALMRQKHLLLATAESCTGGGLAYVLTSIPGCSTWFDRGLVTYSNTSKQELLNITPNMLEKYGAVSAETAKAMAEGALRNTLANITIAITGIAGPDGGTAEKPVGTVWFAIAKDSKGTKTFQKYFIGDREYIRTQAIIFALEKLISFLEGP